MGTRLHATTDTLLWSGADLVAVVFAPLLLLGRLVWPGVATPPTGPDAWPMPARRR